MFELSFISFVIISAVCLSLALYHSSSYPLSSRKLSFTYVAYVTRKYVNDLGYNRIITMLCLIAGWESVENTSQRQSSHVKKEFVGLSLKNGIPWQCTAEIINQSQAKIGHVHYGQ